MVTEGQREGVRGRRTGERTAGQQETRTAGTAVQRDSRREGQRETVQEDRTVNRRTADRETDGGSMREEDRETGLQQNGRTKERTSTVIVMQ